MENKNNEDFEIIVMNLVVDAGSAKSYAMEAITLAKNGSFEEARTAMANADSELVKAHRIQTDLIQQAARGEPVEINLFMVHAQDHIMTAMLAKDLAAEIIDLYERIGTR